MATNIQRFLLLIIGLLFCVLGCTREYGDIPMLDDHSAPMEAHEPVDVEVAFEQNFCLSSRRGVRSLAAMSPMVLTV